MINQLYKTWNITPPPNLEVFTGYEEVYDKLSSYTTDVYKKNPEQTIDEVFNIYRAIDIVPMIYYTELGIINAIKDLANVKANGVKNNIISLGNNQGQTINRFLFPNMLDAQVNNIKNNSLRDRFRHDVKFKRALKICFEHRSGANLVYPIAVKRALELVTGGNIQNFKALNARVIAEHLSDSLFGTVYDFSSGYGGRMLGISTSNMRLNYIGTDPNTETFKNLCYLKDLINEATGAIIEVHNQVSEEFTLPKESVDVAFSSPPYFNLEKYCDEETQCMVKCSTTEDWFELYVKPTINNINNMLVKDGMFAVNIADYKVGSNKIKIVDDWINLTEKNGFEFVKTIKMTLNSRPGVGNDGRQKYEGIYVFKKG